MLTSVKLICGMCYIAFLPAMGLPGTAYAAEPVRIMPMGDSITHGYYTGVTEYNSYRKELKSLLDGGGYATDFTGSFSEGSFADNQHEGHDGWHADDPAGTNDVLGHAASWITATGTDVVLLHIGTNDILDDGANTDEVSQIIDAVFAANSNATVVLALIIGAAPSYDWSGDVSIYNSNLNAMAQIRIAAGDDIIVVDMEHGAGLDYDSDDMIGFHPSPAGYDKMATNWYPAVVEALAHQAALHAPHIASIAVSNDVIVLAFENLNAGRTVSVERAFSMQSTNWPVLDSIVPSASATTWTNTVGMTNTRAFYRINAY